MDNERRQVKALDPTDGRSVVAKVAGPAALLVAKTHKIEDRVRSGREDRLVDKDASDVLRLIQRFPVEQVAPVFDRLLLDPIAGKPTAEALRGFQRLFGIAGGRGTEMASKALRLAMPEERVRAIFLAYAAALAEGLGNEVDSTPWASRAMT